MVKWKKLKPRQLSGEAAPHDSADVRLTFGDSTNLQLLFPVPSKIFTPLFYTTTHKGTTVNRGRCTRLFSANLIIQVYGVVFIKIFYVCSVFRYVYITTDGRRVSQRSPESLWLVSSLVYDHAPKLELRFLIQILTLKLEIYNCL